MGLQTPHFAGIITGKWIMDAWASKGELRMYKAMVQFESVVEAKAFSNLCNELDFKVELISDPYVIDAKSIMGLFTLELSKPIALQAHCTDEAAAAFAEKIRPYMARESDG